jgi:hypothetical protein
LTTFVRISAKLYNFSAVAEIDLDYRDRHAKTGRLPVPDEAGVMLVLCDGSARRYEFGDQAERIRDFFAGRIGTVEMKNLPGDRPFLDGDIRVMDVSPPAPPKPDTARPLAAEAWPSLVAAVQCQAALDRYLAASIPEDVVGSLLADLYPHGFAGGGLDNAIDFVKRVVKHAHSLLPKAEATATA